MEHESVAYRTFDAFNCQGDIELNITAYNQFSDYIFINVNN